MASTTPPPDLKARVKESYNAIAATYNEWTEQHHDLRLRHLDELRALAPDRLGPSAPAPATVLEIGCGAGLPVLRDLLARGGPGLRLAANDLSDVQLGLARANLADAAARVDFLPGDMMDLDFDAGSLAAVVALYSFVHLPQGEQAELLRRIARWLEPGGCLLANFAAVEMKGCVQEQWLTREEGWMFFSGMGVEETARSVKEAGLTVVKHHVVDSTDERLLWVIAKKE